MQPNSSLESRRSTSAAQTQTLGVVTTYVEPHPPLRNAVLAVALLLIIGGFLLKLYAGSRSLPSTSPEEVIRFAASEALLAALFFTAVFAVWSGFVAWLAYRTIASRVWPPTGVLSPVRLKVVTNPNRAVILLAAVAFILCKGAVAALAWQYYLAVRAVAEVLVK